MKIEIITKQIIDITKIENEIARLKEETKMREEEPDEILIPNDEKFAVIDINKKRIKDLKDKYKEWLKQ